MKIKSSTLALIENFGLLDAAVVLETFLFSMAVVSLLSV